MENDTNKFNNSGL